jgi:ubiquinone/menaquinone biosynthesis C-methylase UbiE
MSETPSSIDLQNTLEKADIHHQWAQAYRTPQNEQFYEQVFDYLTQVISLPPSSLVLDAGCGTGAHALRLAQRGLSVIAIDFSESVLAMAEAYLNASSALSTIKLQQENLLSLTFENATFDCIVCWGVLMHVADIETALSELVRVLKPAGTLVISEGNMFSLPSRLSRMTRKLLGIAIAETRSQAGMERWITTPSGTLLIRQANIPWLIQRLQGDGLIVKQHIAGQFTELYARFPARYLQNWVHLLNRLWFRYIKLAGPAFGNIIILQKQKTQ